MNWKSIDSTVDQKLNKWDFINVDSAKNMEHERRTTNKIFNEQTFTNKTIKQKMFLTNRKSFQHRPMRKRRQYQNFQKNWDRKWNDQNLEIRSLAPIGSLLFRKGPKHTRNDPYWPIKGQIRPKIDPNQNNNRLDQARKFRIEQSRFGTPESVSNLYRNRPQKVQFQAQPKPGRNQNPKPRLKNSLQK